MSDYRNVFWNEIDQRMWRTNTSAGDVSIRFEYIGTMTKVEYDLLIEVLWELYDDQRITRKEFESVFGDIRTFCDKIKNLIEES
jgi:DNA-binding ferritin-like protein (Dps family)